MQLKVHEPNLWMEHMLNGEFDKAWQFSDRVLVERGGKPSWHLPRHQQWIWDGSSLENKTVLIRCYHGLGDTIQFIRYAPLVKKIAKKVIVWAQAPLIPLLESVEGIDELLPLHNGVPEAEYDVDVEIMELPHIFRTTIATIPGKLPYLHVEPEFLTNEKDALAIGLVWKAGDWDYRRNIPFSMLQPLFNALNGNIVILQEAPGAASWDQCSGVYPGDVSLYLYAQRIKGLDLLITIDSMPAHLAGALGVPVWTLLHSDADWRWMRDRDDSPWYPTMKLFRQKEQGNWGEAIKHLVSELSLYLRARKDTRICRE
jgi:hypothetical protein